MAREIKRLMLAELQERFRDLRQTGCVVIGYQGLKAAEAMRMRDAIRERGGEMTVVRNSIFALALEQVGAGELARMFQGPTAVVRAENPIAAAKAVSEAAQTFKAIQVRGAYAEGALLDAEGVERLARTPSREVLLGMVAGALLAPLRRLAFGLLAKPRALLNGLTQLKERAGEPAA